MGLIKKRFNILSCLGALIALLVGVIGIIVLFTGQGFGFVENWQNAEGAADFSWLEMAASDIIFGTNEVSMDTFSINGVPLLPIAFYLFVGAAVLALLLLILEIAKKRGFFSRIISLVMMLAFVGAAIIFFVAKVTIPNNGDTTKIDFIASYVTLGGGFMTAAACGLVGGIASFVPLTLS